MIEFRDIKKRFGKNKVLIGVNLEISPGNIQCIIGENGVGKSTLINLSAGLLKLDHGKIIINGEEVTTTNRDSIKKVGFVLEKPIFFDGFTAFEQLSIVGKMYDVNNLNDRIDELLQFFNLPKKGKRIGEYSAGMRSKISFACSIIHKPSILILDEPFKGLDIKIFDYLLEFLKKFSSEGGTVIIATHRTDVIYSIGNKLALLSNGIISFNKSIAKIIGQSSFNEETFRKFVKSQLD